MSARPDSPSRPDLEGLKVLSERDRARLLADLDRHAGRLYRDMSESSLWSTLIAARDEIKALSQGTRHE